MKIIDERVVIPRAAGGAQRVESRLVRSGLLPDEVRILERADAIVEALADEIHQAAVDGTIGRGA